MPSWLYYTLFAFAGVLLLATAAYFYWGYAPVPALPALGAAAQPQQVVVGARTRTYLAYVPANLPARPGLLLVLHGSNLTGTIMRQWSGYAFDELADRYGFIVLYPDGYKRHWNDCRATAPNAAKRENVDDEGFMRALVARYQASHQIDPARVFAFGYSNGGHMAFRLALAQPRLVASIAAVAATLPTPANCRCTWPAQSPPILLVTGTADNISPYEGGEVKLFGANYGQVLSARATAEEFVRHGGSVGSPTTEHWPATGGSTLALERRSWANAERPLVTWYTIVGGGHVVPQARFRFPRFNGRTATNLDAPAEAVAFFELNH